MNLSNILSLPHNQLNTDGEKYTTMSNLPWFFTEPPHSQWMPWLPILTRNRNNQKYHKLSLHPPWICICIHLPFFHPVPINELCGILSTMDIPICVLHSIPSHLLNGISPAILLSPFLLESGFSPCCFIPFRIPIFTYVTK